MKETPRLWFVDFWHKESVESLESGNGLYRALSQNFDVRLDPVRPEFLLCSTFGRRHYCYDCTKILFVGENIYPDFQVYDWAFSFDPTEGRNFRLPLWAVEIGDPSSLLCPVKDPVKLLKSKEQFCAYDRSNPGCEHKNKLIRLLSSRKRVDAADIPFYKRGGGRCKISVHNDLSNFYTRYKFTIAFENDSSPGYTTEKIAIPLLGASIPIYWGNPEIAGEFNPGSFINAHDFNSLEELANYVLEVDANDELYLRYLTAPRFEGNILHEDADWNVFADRMQYIFSKKVDSISSRGIIRQDYRPLIPSALLRMEKRKLKRSSIRSFNPSVDIGQTEIPDRIRASKDRLGTSGRRHTPRVWFTDFQFACDTLGIHLQTALSKHFEIQLDPNNPEFLLCGCHGRRHERYSCTKVLFIHENSFPDFRLYDWAFSLDPTEGRNFRLPPWSIWMGDPSAMANPVVEPAALLKNKNRFCAFVYTNPNCGQRNEFFRELSFLKHVDAAGRLFNNTNGLSDRFGMNAFRDLPKFYAQYKFVIAFENCSAPGYTSEKIVAALLGGAVPIYWGNPNIVEEFNPEAFINAHDFGSFKELAEYVIQVNADDERYLRYLSAPRFVGGALPEDADWEVLASRVERIFSERVDPVSKRGLAQYVPVMPSWVLRKVRKRTRINLFRPSHKMRNPTLNSRP